MRLTDLRHKKIRTLDGKSLGRVYEVHCAKGVVTALICGPASLLERFTARRHGRRIPWACVSRIDDQQIIVTPDPPQRAPKKPSAPRSRPGTRRPSGRRSAR